MHARGRLQLMALAASVALHACADDVPLDHDAGASNAKTLVVLPDTQFYACAYPEIFEHQARWVVEQRRARGIAMLLHTGDVVDLDMPAQWQVAARSMHMLDGKVPYLISTGNHDLSLMRGSLVSDYFDGRAMRALDLEFAAFDAARIDNTYAVVQLDGRDWLMLGLEFGPRDAVVAWADKVLRDHRELPAVLFTHAYLYSDGERYDRAHAPHQPYHPDDYAFTPEQGINDGQDLWAKLVEPHENVRLVLSGHVIPDGTAHSSVARASGSTVHQVLANYQRCDACPCSEVEGGGGYLRVLEFNADAIHVTTYSPHRDEWLTDAENDFTLSLAR